MKKPSPKILSLILKASLKDKIYLKDLSNKEIIYLYSLGVYQIQKLGFDLNHSVKLLLLIKEEISSRA